MLRKIYRLIKSKALAELMIKLIAILYFGLNSLAIAFAAGRVQKAYYVYGSKLPLKVVDNSFHHLSALLILWINYHSL